ncbi:NAD(P)-binding protein [Aspergillus granulosus]|uniref:3beta-hydroxysteroid 3-dehydrogenase n=1 Tax=Aspergillus granulosus TaxID=176169 RepID=A0ABR4HZ59_9EURO
MPGTIIITGANGSLATPAVRALLSKYSEYTLILTARNPDTVHSPTDLRNVSIRKLNLCDLSSVHDFATEITTEIQAGSLPPLTSIICNAYHWNLCSKAETTGDRFEKTFQVNHIAHAALVLRLIGRFDKNAGGRVVLFSSDAHWPGQNGLEKIPPAIPHNLDALVKISEEKETDYMGRGFQRYANSKLAIVMWMYALNRHLEADLALNKITAVAVNPGNLADSRALRVNTPVLLKIMSILIVRPFSFLLRRFSDPTMRTSAEAAEDIVGFATNTTSPGERGYYTLSQKDVSSPDSLDEAKQNALWTKTIEWAGITGENTALQINNLHVDNSQD